MAARSTASNRLMLLAAALVLLGAAARCQAQRYCPRQKLVVVRPEDLGVTHITLYGEVSRAQLLRSRELRSSAQPAAIAGSARH